jgi:hypothetical protein
MAAAIRRISIGLPSRNSNRTRFVLFPPGAPFLPNAAAAPAMLRLNSEMLSTARIAIPMLPEDGAS